MLPLLVECYRAIDKQPYLDAKIESWVIADPTLRASRIRVCRDHRQSRRVRRAHGRVESFVLEHPVLANLVNAAELAKSPAAEARRAIERIARAYARSPASARYRCTNCGYSTQQFIWHCPSCKLWETVRPIQSLPLENVLARSGETARSAEIGRLRIAFTRRLASPLLNIEGVMAMKRIVRWLLGARVRCSVWRIRGAGEHQHGRRGYARERAQGVGPALAQAIVKDRAEHGNFDTPDALTRVKGIGARIVEINKANIWSRIPRPKR